MESVIEVLERQRGLATFAELVQATSRRQLAEAVRLGLVERLGRGLYVLPGRPTDRTVAVAYDGVVSHLSAAVEWDLPLLVQPANPTSPCPRNAVPGEGRPRCCIPGRSHPVIARTGSPPWSAR